MYHLKRLDKNREYIYHFLNRMKKYNCPIAINCEFDVTDTLAAIEKQREQGRDVGLIALLTKATAKAIEKHPRFNDRIYHTLLGKRVVSYDQITCGMLVEREAPEGEYILLPLNIHDAPNLTIEEIHRKIRDYKTKPLEEIKAYRQLTKLHRMPRWLIPLVHFLMRTHPRYTGKTGNTYAISSVIQENGAAIAGVAPAYKTTFFPFNVLDEPRAYKGEIVIRKVLRMMISVDHYLIDGMDLFRSSGTLKDYLEDPTILLEP